ncbi:DUF402 domain-containing protein [Corynebacterium alimapuense]|uniref:DUF402 domain-containing protein n=1 Tax=Corynebacterium alimapuense TaxID=1576874 RepID=A0A3M8K5M6_9CORY|nr:DUF402 domain-containing protein [Corynebacterium alimapuense]RNE48476.1 DUF402 domain-containing protein [Corynebacterium alimapuense]
MTTDLHPVKNETFDIPGRVNLDPKGFRRDVDSYQETDFGLYMARGADHPRFGYLESWLLPEHLLRVNIFHFRDGINERQDFYIDIADITVQDEVWSTRDLYVDLVSITGEPLSILDIDELAAATSAGLITAADAERAIDATLAAVEGITRHGDDVSAWLETLGIDLTWAESVELSPSE